jgi:hypothetical protein
VVTVIDVLKQSKALCGKVCSITCDAACCEGSLVPEYEANRVSELIDAMPSTIGQISDGYHTFDELYEHRFELWMAICRNLRRDIAVYKSRVQSDGTSYPGWFLLAMGTKAGSQISYHLPNRLWDACDFEEMMPPPFDGHTSADVLERLRTL